jgi:hypothetical protein
MAKRAPTSSYPRPGEPLAPQLLRSLFDEVTAELDPEIAPLFREGADIWRRLTPATGADLADLFLERVTARLPTAPRSLLETPLPPPAVALAHLPIERRTANTLRRLDPRDAAEGGWNVGRYLQIQRFGARSLVDLLASMEARVLGERGGPSPAVLPVASEPRATSTRPDSDSMLHRAISLVTRRLPISQSQANDQLAKEGKLKRPIDLADLAHAFARAGRRPGFRLVDIAGERIAVRPAQLTAAGAAYAIASRAVYNWGATTVRGVAQQVCVMLSLVVGVVFVERLLSAVSSFEWLDPDGGWFWFIGRPNRLLSDVRKVLSVTTRLSLARLWQALKRGRVAPELPPPPVLGRMCMKLPDTGLAGDVVVLDSPVAAAPPLNAAERRLVQILEESGPVHAADLRHLGKAAGLSPATLNRLLRVSPLLERLPDRTFALVGRSETATSA